MLSLSEHNVAVIAFFVIFTVVTWEVSARLMGLPMDYSTVLVHVFFVLKFHIA